MALGSWIDMLSPEDKKLLLDIARKSIQHGLEKGSPLPIQLSDYSGDLPEKRATFVTLKIQNELRGCIGVLEASRTLVEDVASNAYSAAFRDSRFSSITESELSKLSISISILSPPEEIEFDSEEDLLNKIRPNVDGLILEDGLSRGTFLPSVWENVSSPKEFLQHLKLKAGLPIGYWSETIHIKRYTTESIGE